MLYALIPNIPLKNVNERPIKPNKLVMLYDKKKGKNDHLKHKKHDHCFKKHFLLSRCKVLFK